jgi:outer membrane protein assembly factor BamD
MAQAEAEYKDFITFFPNMPEAAEAQLKVAGIHYKQMEKPDRDFTHAKRAEDEYRQLIQQFPDSKLVPEAKQHLREVQEVLADREFRIGRFYYLRQSYAAAIARLRTLADQYPLYSNAEEALFLLGQSYEGQVGLVREAKGMDSASREKLIGEMHKHAAEAYSRIITRYPMCSQAEQARARLRDLSFPVPEPTKEAIAQYKKEEEGRTQTGMMGSLMGNFRSHPDLSAAAKAGEPSLEDIQMTNATQVVKELGDVLKPTKPAKSSTGIEKVDPSKVKSESVPRSDSGQANAGQAESAQKESAQNTEPNGGQTNNSTDGSAQTEGSSTPAQSTSQPGNSSGETQPKTLPATKSVEQVPSVGSEEQKPATAPTQVNEANTPEQQQNNAQSSDSSSTKDTKDKDSSKNESTSKKKKKKKLGIF